MTRMICEISVDNRLEQLTEIYRGLESFVDSNGLSDDIKNRLFLVTEELFTNLVRYGYQDGVGDLIVITAERLGADVRLTIRDHAAAFDLTQPPKAPSSDADIESMEIGGLGLFLVHEFARSVESRREGSANITELVLPL
ncbi:ATP-binding protein [Rhizobium jaguaris]|uniref:ATP-binding protein n=1 Tax=Rhizobium jaguaris TaxID=1312183 RepID=A0A387G1L1_9HYPH|nr:ATP-binding protein [Rhizobium jaguaris]AYG61902.1 ATP-binding protein [Rhizobium jaguaris]